MQRNVIVLNKNLPVGKVGNVAAILMGQLALTVPDIFSSHPLSDQDGVQHAGIKYSTVILKAGPGQLLKLAQETAANSAVHSLVFTETGQSLNDEFATYAQTITTSSTEALKPVGVIISGEDGLVRQLSKKFSVFN